MVVGLNLSGNGPCWDVSVDGTMCVPPTDPVSGVVSIEVLILSTEYKELSFKLKKNYKLCQSNQCRYVFAAKLAIPYTLYIK